MNNNYNLPSTVLQTAVMPGNDSDSMVIDWETADSTSKYLIYWHFADLDPSEEHNNNRIENIYLNGGMWSESFNPPYMMIWTIYSTDPFSGERFEFSFNKSKKSVLLPIVNAVELYQLKTFPQLLTNQQDGMYLCIC